jgi:hypothetical protein
MNIFSFRKLNLNTIAITMHVIHAQNQKQLMMMEFGIAISATMIYVWNVLSELIIFSSSNHHFYFSNSLSLFSHYFLYFSDFYSP